MPQPIFPLAGIGRRANQLPRHCLSIFISSKSIRNWPSYIQITALHTSAVCKNILMLRHIFPLAGIVRRANQVTPHCLSIFISFKSIGNWPSHIQITALHTSAVCKNILMLRHIFPPAGIFLRSNPMPPALSGHTYFIQIHPELAKLHSDLHYTHQQYVQIY
jgi:hypothetical protein